MATARPVVSVLKTDGEKDETVSMPSVFTTPLRPDLVRMVHTNMAKNHRQAYAITANSGYQHSAESWGTGRAVSRIPRVSGGGTHGAGAGTFGNMCRGGGMFNPTKTWRRWHRKTNTTQKRHALASSLAASALPALLMARGHRVNDVAEVPIVVSDSMQQIQKTKTAVALLKTLGLGEEMDKVLKSKKLRRGVGKMRNRRYVMNRGPLVIYDNDEGISKGFRNIPGVQVCNVERMNLLKLAPGGTFGRLCVWSKSAFKKLQPLFGSHRAGSEMKKGYHLMRAPMVNADLARIINSDEVQSVVNPAKQAPKKTAMQKKNPLKNPMVMARLNPGALEKKAARNAKHHKVREVIKENLKKHGHNRKRHHAHGHHGAHHAHRRHR